MRASIFSLTCLSGLCVVLLSGCPTPEYPACENDEHCKEGEFCVNKKCQQCRNDADCGDGQKCNAGRCEKPECSTSSDCPDGKVCKSEKCVACAADADCGEGGQCKDGACLRPGQCSKDEDCPENHECQNGTCVAPPPPPTDAGPCTPPTVYFDFNEFVLTSKGTASLQEAAKCIKSVTDRRIRVEGHCDPRGTEEYNLALGDRRARSVVRYLKRLGIKTSRLRPVSKGKLEATGGDAAGWAMDRKVIFAWE